MYLRVFDKGIADVEAHLLFLGLFRNATEVVPQFPMKDYHSYVVNGLRQLKERIEPNQNIFVSVEEPGQQISELPT